MYFDLYLRKECILLGKEFSNLFNNMKDDDDLENKHKKCLEYYKGEDLILYKLKIEPIINHILNTNNKENSSKHMKQNKIKKRGGV